jgi:hypothetical protein
VAAARYRQGKDKEADAMNTTVTDRLLTGIESADFTADLWTADAVFDATVPNWRFAVHGREQINTTLTGWFAEQGRFEEVRRTPLPGGELVEFVLSWTEQGVPHACHQAHILRIENDRIAAHTAFCGGRWSASLLAEMEEAAHA